MKSTNDVIIIGGGIIGCSIAYQLAREGFQVTVIEKSRPGGEASRAAAGMLAPQAEAAHGLQGPLAELCYASLALYPEFVNKLEADSGMHIGYQTTGSIYVAADYIEAKMLAGLLERLLKANRQAEELSKKQLQEFEPALPQTVETSVYLPGDHSVDNRQLMTALVSAASKLKVEFLLGTPVLGLEISKNRVEGVRIPGRTLKGGMVIITAGAWSGNLETTGQIKLPVRPIRGQIVCLDYQPQQLTHLIHASGFYLVPWPDGRVLIGSTVENVGYHKVVTAQGIQQLLQAAITIVPSLAEASIGEIWAGLRPETPDGLPVLGRTQISNLIIATGHYRNGILLAPLTAKLITELIIQGQPSMSLQPFLPDRFDE